MAFIWALAGGVIAAALGWLINRFSPPAWLTKGRSLALTAVLVVAGAGVGVLARGHFGPGTASVTASRPADDRLYQEEHVIAQLAPGQTYAQLKQLLGGKEPDRQTTLDAGFVALFEREWEYVDTVVDANGATESIAVILKDDRFRLASVGGWPSPFGSMIADYERQLPSITGLMGYCGANRALYVEMVDTGAVPASRHSQSIAFGHMNEGPIDCPSSGSIECNPDDASSSFSFAGCLTTTAWDGPDGRRFRQSTPVRAVVVTAPARHLDLNMLFLPDDIGP